MDIVPVFSNEETLSTQFIMPMKFARSLPHLFPLKQIILPAFTLFPQQPKSTNLAVLLKYKFSYKQEMGHCVHAHSHPTTPTLLLVYDRWTSP